VAFTARRGNDVFLVEDGREDQVYGSINLLGLRSKTRALYYTVYDDQKEKHFLVDNGVRTELVAPETRALELANGSLVTFGTGSLSVDGRRRTVDFDPFHGGSWGFLDGRLCFISSRQDGKYMVIGTEEVGPFQSVGSVVLDPISQDVGFIAETKNGMNYVYRNTKMIAEFTTRVGGLSLGRSEGSYACIVSLESSDYAVVDGKVGKFYSEINGLVVNKNRTRVAYAAGIRQYTMCIVLDGEEGKEYQQVSNPVFDPTGSVVAYAAKSKDGWRVIVGTKESESFEDIDEICDDPDFQRYWKRLKFSDDGTSVSFGALRKNHLLWVVLFLDT
jgi:hypothetical protein